MNKKLTWLGGLFCVAMAACVLFLGSNEAGSERLVTSGTSPSGETGRAVDFNKDLAHNRLRTAARARSDSAFGTPTDDARKAGADDDGADLEKYVGEKTAAAIAAGGPFNAFHVRTMARSLKNYEEYLARLRENNVPPAEMKRAMRTYASMQNHYYAALDDIEPYKPKAESAERLKEWKDAVESQGDDLTKEERKALKREILLRGMTEQHQ